MKKIIGFIGDHKSGRTTASNILKKNGFYVISINDKVLDVASHLFGKSELNKNKASILNGVRKRGYSVFKEYWLNLSLITIPEGIDLVVFDDLSVEEMETGKVDAYQIYREGVSREKLDGVETIENNGSLEDFERKVEDFFKKIIPKKVVHKSENHV
jgi:dephospho-CoA kinase